MFAKVVLCHFLSCILLMKAGVVSEQWHKLRCSSDSEQRLPEGTLADIGRFPWLGVVQHNFVVGGAARFAITPGVLIHPAHAIAPAYDIARIAQDELANNTKFILWYSQTVKYAMQVRAYTLHPEYDVTMATLALLELVMEGQTSVATNPYAVLPVCLPLSGGGTYTGLYAVRMTDQNKILQKEVYKMKYVNDEECRRFYDKNQLSIKKLTPKKYICAVVERPMAACVWDGGAALITRQHWGFWKILGFSVRGAGCGAPARFLLLGSYLPWVDQLLTAPESEDGVYRIGVRRFSPVKIQLYKASTMMPKDIGVCDRKSRGSVLYKDSVEVTATKDFGQGFFYVIISQIAQFQCAVVTMQDISYRSNTALWVEHYCHREITGLAVGHGYPRDYRKQECFMYFRSSAFVTFRFVFSFKTVIEVTVYGREELPKFVPDPFIIEQTTEAWVPTDRIIKWDSFFPYGRWTWNL